MTIKVTVDEAGRLLNIFNPAEAFLDVPKLSIEVDAETAIGLINGKLLVNGVALDAPAPAASLADLQSQKLSEINSAAQSQANTLTSDYPEFERLSWATQQTECSAWFAVPDTSRLATLVPWCAACAASRGVDLSDFMALVKANVDAFIAASAQIAGRRQALATAIYSCADDEAGRAALTAISWSAP